jgi:hypothetical protein
MKNLKKWSVIAILLGLVLALILIENMYIHRNKDIKLSTPSILYDSQNISSTSSSATIQITVPSTITVSSSSTKLSARGTTQLFISKINPSSGPIGTEVTITGSGFTKSENSVIFGNAVTISNLSSSDSTHLIFIVPQNAGPVSCTQSIPGHCTSSPTIPESYGVQVKNTNGFISIKGIEFLVTN